MGRKMTVFAGTVNKSGRWADLAAKRKEWLSDRQKIMKKC